MPYSMRDIEDACANILDQSLINLYEAENPGYRLPRLVELALIRVAVYNTTSDGITPIDPGDVALLQESWIDVNVKHGYFQYLDDFTLAPIIFPTAIRSVVDSEQNQRERESLFVDASSLFYKIFVMENEKVTTETHGLIMKWLIRMQNVLHGGK